LCFLLGEDSVDVCPALDPIEDDVIPVFYLAPYSVITDPYSVVSLIPFHLLDVELGQIVKLRDLVED